ncbi:hypothetical protein [Novosphingobium sp. CECT 9465]|uniref:hypothetical protein n=1 Tax=Novosphingobium sp. CECT 9465 TaxID=2829794 RepID=UPI001E56CF0B|nr:hypothetical protein [Novosphingobium sp. CECT 9465]CAH0498975.1 hypothetical protein NVSP9465_04071 [Novosphingobium sp. CECT 9465]
MKLKTKISLAIASIAMLGAVPVAAASVGHSWFMRGSIVGEQAEGKVVCIGSEDGATVGQILDAYKVVQNPGPGNKGAGPTFRRERTGHVRIDHVYDAHFAHVSVVDGAPSVHDIVELRRTRR